MPQSAVRKYEEDDHLLDEAEANQREDAVAEAEPETTEVDMESAEAKEEPVYHYTIDTSDPDPWLVKHRSKLLVLLAVTIAVVAGSIFYKNMVQAEQTQDYIAYPQVNDLYYVDFRVIKDNLRPAEKFRMAKVSDITGDVVTINFSSYFYLQEHELNEAIRYAQLRFDKFFQEKRHNYSISQLEEMIESGAITLARRPQNNMLDGNVVIPDSHFAKNKLFIPGRKENLTGLEYLKIAKMEIKKTGKTDSDEAFLAFAKFKESADFGFNAGEVNLAEMYIDGIAAGKDLYEAAALLKNASLQGYEPAILKYTIVCNQIESCMISDFYGELSKAGVNIEFTKQADVRATTKDFERAMKDAQKRKEMIYKTSKNKS